MEHWCVVDSNTGPLKTLMLRTLWLKAHYSFTTVHVFPSHEISAPAHPVGCCLLYAVRAVGVEQGGPAYECLALWDGMCGLRSPLVLPLGRLIMGGKTVALRLPNIKTYM